MISLGNRGLFVLKFPLIAMRAHCSFCPMRKMCRPTFAWIFLLRWLYAKVKRRNYLRHNIRKSRRGFWISYQRVFLPKICDAIIANPQAANATLLKLIQSLAQSDPVVLSLWARAPFDVRKSSPNDYVRWELAKDLRTPAEILDELSFDHGIACEDYQAWYVMEAVAGNPNTPAATLQRISSQSITGRGGDLITFESALLRNPNSPADLRAELETRFPVKGQWARKFIEDTNAQRNQRKQTSVPSDEPSLLNAVLKADSRTAPLLARSPNMPWAEVAKLAGVTGWP